MFQEIKNSIALIESIQSNTEVIMEGREDKMTINNWIAFERIFDAYSVKVDNDQKFNTVDIWVDHHLVGQWYTGLNLGWFNKALLSTLPVIDKELAPIEDPF